MEAQPFTGGVYPLFSQLCKAVLAQTYAEGGSQCDHLRTNFESPSYDILRRGLDHNKVVQHLVRMTFDLILLRKWVWFGTWQSDMTPECRCLSYTYKLCLEERQGEATRLEQAISSFMGKECPVQERSSVLKFLALMAGSGRPQAQTMAPFVPCGGVFHYETYPSSLFEQLPAVGSVHGLHSAALESAELFECAPGTGFTGFFTAMSVPPGKTPPTTTLFDGLAHCVTSDLNTPLDLPNIPSQADSISLLPDTREKGVDSQAVCRTSGMLNDSGCGSSQDDSTLSLLSSLGMMEDTPLPTQAWEGWEDGKRYLSETARDTFDHSMGVCLARLTRLTSIELPLEVTGGPGALRKLAASLDALPPTVLQPLEDGGSVARAFARVVSTLLLHCQLQLLKLEGKSNLYLQSSANGIFHLVRFLFSLVGNISACPKGLPLLDCLYSKAMAVQGTPHYPLLLSLLRLAAMPYLQFVCQWVFHGWLDREEEFGLQAHESFLIRRDHLYWSEGYTASFPCTPEFLRQHSTALLTAGKALNLLKMCCPTHPLCDGMLKPPRIVLAISMDELEEVRQQWQAYSSMVTTAVEKQKEERLLKELQKEQQAQEVVVRARKEARKAMERSRSFEQAQLKEMQERKKSLQIDLKQQMEEARALQTERVAKEREADKELLDAMLSKEEAITNRERQLEEEAKAELVTYYDELSREAETRRLRAEWRMKRLQMSVERRRFLQGEREKWKREMEERGKEGGGETEGQVETTTSETNQEITLVTTEVRGSPQGDGHRTRQTWAEDKGDLEEGPLEPGQRKTWVASLIGSAPTLTFPPESPQTDSKDLSPQSPPSPSALHESQPPPVLEGTPFCPSPPPPALATPPRPQPFTPEQSPQSSERGKSPTLQRSPSFLGQRRSPPEGVSRSSGTDHIPHRKRVPGSGIHDSVVQEALYGQEKGDWIQQASRRRLEWTPGTDSGLAAGVESGHGGATTPRLVSSRGHGPPSVAQDIIYPETPWSAPPEEQTTPRLVSTRGSQPPSIARDIFYPRVGANQLSEGEGALKAGGEITTPRLETSRGHAPPSVIQDIMYAHGSPRAGAVTQGSEDPGDPRLVSSRGHAPPSTIQDILYSRGRPVEVFKSTRGTAPPSSIEYKLYPGKYYAPPTEQTEPAAREEEGNSADPEMPPPFQPYRVSYPELDLPPDTDFLDRVLGPPPSSPPTDADLLSVYPLPALVEDSIALPILTQSRLVNSALVEHFFTEYRISRHFVALKRFLLLEDGEFGHSLATKLFEELTYGRTWRHLCSPSFLNPLLSSALDSSLHGHSPETHHLSFALRHQPQGIKTHAVEALEFLELQYKVEWPCNIVISQNSVAMYNKVFQLLLQLKRASWALKNVFAHLKKCEGLERGQHRQLQTYRHELQDFINVMEGYLMNQIFYLSWREFEMEIKQNVHSLDDLIAAHQRFIEKAIYRCLLSKKAKPVMNIIRGVFSAILKFSTQLTMSTLGPQGSYRAMCDTHQRFREAAGLLIKVVTKLIQRGYQPHLEDFMLRLNFNGFYR